jgi:hypothetical protein
MSMNYKIAILTVLIPSAAMASQEFDTTFTLGNPTSNCIPVTSQDGASVTDGSGEVCPLGFNGQGDFQLLLPADPVAPGNPLGLTACQVSTISDTRVISTKPQPASSKVQSVGCTTSYGSFTATWSGTLTYNYVSVKQTKCSSGRGGHCVTQYYPVWLSGSGLLETTTP